MADFFLSSYLCYPLFRFWSDFFLSSYLCYPLFSFAFLHFLHFCWRWGKFFDLYGGRVLIKVRNDKSARRGSIELFNRLCVLAVKKLHFVCWQPVSLKWRFWSDFFLSSYLCYPLFSFAFLHFCWRWGKFFDLYGGRVLIKVRNDKSARRGSIELFNRLCVLAVKKLHFVCWQPVSLNGGSDLTSSWVATCVIHSSVLRFSTFVGGGVSSLTSMVDVCWLKSGMTSLPGEEASSFLTGCVSWLWRNCTLSADSLLAWSGGSDLTSSWVATCVIHSSVLRFSTFVGGGVSSLTSMVDVCWLKSGMTSLPGEEASSFLTGCVSWLWRNCTLSADSLLAWSGGSDLTSSWVATCVIHSSVLRFSTFVGGGVSSLTSMVDVCWLKSGMTSLPGDVLIKVRNDKRRGSIELFNRLCVLAVKKLHFVCWQPVSLKWRFCVSDLTSSWVATCVIHSSVLRFSTFVGGGVSSLTSMVDVCWLKLEVAFSVSGIWPLWWTCAD